MSFIWNQLGKNIDGEANGNQSGYSISLSNDGTIVAIGAPNTNNDSGQCQVYKLETSNGTTGWIQVGQDINGVNEGDEFGFSVSLSSDGSMVAIGAPYEDDLGKTHVYQLGLTGEIGTTGWIQIGQNIDGKTSGDQSGHSVSLSGDGTTVAIGAPFHQGPNGVASGLNRIYKVGLTGGPGTTGWIQLGSDINGQNPGDRSGFSVSLSNDGTIIAIGAPYNDNGGTLSGYFRIFKLESTGWMRIGIVNGQSYDNSGYSVSLSGDGTMVAIGSPNINNSVGCCRVYQFITTGGTTGFIQVGQKISKNESTQFGWSVSLSRDGTNVAIGSPYTNNFSGQSNVYKLGSTGGTTGWISLGQDIDGETIEKSGYSVSLSGDGTILAIGAPNNNTNGINSGQSRIYQLGTTGSTGENVVCYKKGTLILTKRGYVQIELIKKGHEVVTKGTIYKNGIQHDDVLQLKPVIWINNFKVKYLNSNSRPICITKHAFGKNFPFRDLYVSPKHGIFFNGKMIQAKDFINGTTIYQDTECDSVEYYHLECKEHSLIVANGILAESYLDLKNKYVFYHKKDIFLKKMYLNHSRK
jgi:hypothetical protein